LVIELRGIYEVITLLEGNSELKTHYINVVFLCTCAYPCLLE